MVYIAHKNVHKEEEKFLGFIDLEKPYLGVKATNYGVVCILLMRYGICKWDLHI